ncbi:hypothetical protein LT85_1387 [Collimonas arenae]|uniref:Uncharacterized protein n=1 Tax=Collimonas arenae TaxID=279058 RepID=A0A0A1F9T1_9BURK|nr:hypothetical protein LT85_1387 [Collimonas arenae]
MLALESTIAGLMASKFSHEVSFFIPWLIAMGAFAAGCVFLEKIFYDRVQFKLGRRG